MLGSLSLVCSEGNTPAEVVLVRIIYLSTWYIKVLSQLNPGPGMSEQKRLGCSVAVWLCGRGRKMIVYICSDQPNHASLAARLININMESSNNTTIKTPGFSVLAYCLLYKCKLQCLNILFRLASLSGKMKINQLLLFYVESCSWGLSSLSIPLYVSRYLIFPFLSRNKDRSPAFSWKQLQFRFIKTLWPTNWSCKMWYHGNRPG